MPDALTHGNVSCYIQTSETGLEGHKRKRAHLYEVKKRVEGQTTILSCYLASQPGLYFRFMFHYGSTKEANKRPWALASDQFIKMYMDGSPDPIQEIDVDRDAHRNWNPFKAPGIFLSGEEQLSLFQWASRNDAAYEVKENELPEGSTVDDLACAKVAFHRCEITSQREARPEEAGPDEDDKELIKARGSHPRLSEYITLGQVLTEEKLEASFKEEDYSQDVGVTTNIEDEPWLVFEFRYKSSELLEELGIKPKSLKRTSTEAQKTAKRARQTDEGLNPRRSARHSVSSSPMPAPHIPSLSPEEHHSANQLPSPARNHTPTPRLPDLSQQTPAEPNMEIDTNSVEIKPTLDRKPKLEDLKPKIEDVKLKIEDVKPKTEDVRPKTEDVKPETEVVEPKTEDVRVKAVDSKRTIADPKPNSEKKQIKMSGAKQPAGVSARKSSPVKGVISLCSSDDEESTPPSKASPIRPSQQRNTSADRTSESTILAPAVDASPSTGSTPADPEQLDQKPKVGFNNVKHRGFGRRSFAKP